MSIRPSFPSYIHTAVFAILLFSISAFAANAEEIALQSDEWRITVHPESLEVIATPYGKDRIHISAPQENLGAVYDLEQKGDEVSWKLPSTAYKKKKGFPPLQMTCLPGRQTRGRYIIDAVFRGGKKHSNNGDTVVKVVREIVPLIQRRYSEDAPIILRTDGGFFAEDNFEELDELGIGFVCGGRLYDDIGEFVRACDKSAWGVYGKGGQQWEALPFGDRCKSWKRFWRALFWRPLTEDGQYLLEFARPDTVLYSNSCLRATHRQVGMGRAIDEALVDAGLCKWLSDEGILMLAHGRGSDELVRRALKDFGTEQLPFKRFDLPVRVRTQTGSNAALRGVVPCPPACKPTGWKWGRSRSII